MQSPDGPWASLTIAPGLIAIACDILCSSLLVQKYAGLVGAACPMPRTGLRRLRSPSGLRTELPQSHVAVAYVPSCSSAILT